MKSKARIILPQLVPEDMDKVRVFALGSEDREGADGEINSNGCAIQVHMQAAEELSVDLIAKSTGTQFEKVKAPDAHASRAPGTGLEGIQA